jgi:tetraacyldisaccharide 4'-kinase
MRTARVSSLKNGSEALSSSARVAAFCAVGNPHSFFEHVRRSGYELALQKSFPDHHVYSQDEIDALSRAAEEVGASALITTAKDAVKLRTLSFPIPCYVLEIEIDIEGAEELAQLVNAKAQRH